MSLAVWLSSLLSITNCLLLVSGSDWCHHFSCFSCWHWTFPALWSCEKVCRLIWHLEQKSGITISSLETSVQSDHSETHQSVSSVIEAISSIFVDFEVWLQLTPALMFVSPAAELTPRERCGSTSRSSLTGERSISCCLMDLFLFSPVSASRLSRYRVNNRLF